MSVNHSFKVEDAEKYGVNAAILLNNIQFWVTKNYANESNNHDGVTYTYNTVKAFAKLFPYIGKGAIKSALGKLIDANEIMVGNFNKSAYDRTLWYGISNERIRDGYSSNSISDNKQHHLPKSANGFNDIGQPIPDITSPITSPITKDTEKEKNAISIKLVIDYFNKKRGSRFEAKGEGAKFINNLLVDGYSVDDMKKVIDDKTAAWGNDLKMNGSLKPTTLFRACNFSDYLGVASAFKPASHNGKQKPERNWDAITGGTNKKTIEGEFTRE